MDLRPGDWYCEDSNCGNHNFARRTDCNKCGKPKGNAVGSTVDPRGGRGRGGAAGQKRFTPNSGMGGFQGKKQRTALDNVHRFLVPSDRVQVIIGKGGAKIKQATTEIHEVDPEGKVSIYAQQANGQPLDPNACDRVMGIQANMEGLQVALTKIIPDLQYKGHEDKKQKFEVKFMAPAHSTSAVIGKGGEVIKRIKSETKSFIQVYTVSLPQSNETVIRMQNFELADLAKTVLLVVEAISANKASKPIMFYDPISFYQGEYGDTGSCVDALFFQQEISAGRAGLTPYQQKGNAGWNEGAYGGGYAAQPAAGYGGYGAADYGGYGAADHGNYGGYY